MARAIVDGNGDYSMIANRDKPLSTAEKVQLANQLFHEFYAACFWHWRPDLVITEATLPALAQGLRTHGGRRGMLAAEKLVR
jgi:hypothetical protein